MRHRSPQLPLTAPWIAHAHANELAAMSALLDEQPGLAQLIQQDLEAAARRIRRRDGGASRASRRSRVLIVRQLTGWTYAELAFHLADSATYRAFCRIGALAKPPSKSALAAARRSGPASDPRDDERAAGDECGGRAVDPARTVRMDATVVPMAIHHPTDSSLLRDAVRVLDRLLQRMEPRRRLHRVSSPSQAREAPRDGDRHIWHRTPCRRRRACYRELDRL